MYNKEFSTLQHSISERWHKAAQREGILEEAYSPDVKIVEDPTGKSSYTFGVIRNEHRYKRLDTNSDKEELPCNLCNAVSLASEDDQLNLLPSNKSRDFIVTINKFPLIKGFSLAIIRNERPMFTTQDLEGIGSELAYMFQLADETGFEIFHNSPGFGATIPTHEHYHLTTFREGYNIAGTKYGFDAAKKESSRKDSSISFMPEFPFTHLIFPKEDPEKIVSFLSRLEKSLGDRFENEGVPHTISQGYEGVLITIGKSYLSRCRGSGDVAGHMVIKSEEDFLKFSYDDCITEMDKLLFKKEDMDLEKFI